MKKRIRERIIREAKKALSVYEINFEKFSHISFYANEGEKVALVEFRKPIEKIGYAVENVYYNEKTGEILQWETILI